MHFLYEDRQYSASSCKIALSQEGQKIRPKDQSMAMRFLLLYNWFYFEIKPISTVYVGVCICVCVYVCVCVHVHVTAKAMTLKFWDF